MTCVLVDNIVQYSITHQYYILHGKISSEHNITFI